MRRIIKKNYVSFRAKKKCDERQNQRACTILELLQRSYVKNKIKNGQMNGIFMLRLILQIQNIV